MKLTAKPVRQGETVYYVTSLPTDVLIDEELVRVDRWDPKGGTGYQRELNVPHIRRIARYLQGEEDTNVLPTSVILNSRKPLKVTRLGDGMVEVELDDKTFPLYITDGQHRIAAMRQVSEMEIGLDNYELAVTLTNFSLDEEISHFRKVNTSANRAPKGLDQQLMARLNADLGTPRTTEEAGLDRAVGLITRLATDADSVWYGRVALGGQRKRSDHTMAQSPWVTSVEQLFTRGRFADPDEDMNQVYQVFFDFWEAVGAAFPDAVNTASRYSLLGPSGVNAWHIVLGRTLGVKPHPTRDDFRTLIEGMKDKTHMDAKFWEKTRGKARLTVSQYGSRQAYNLLADEIWYNMDKSPLRGEAVVGR